MDCFVFDLIFLIARASLTRSAMLSSFFSLAVRSGYHVVDTVGYFNKLLRKL